MTAYIEALKDAQGYLHAPMHDEGADAVCNMTGVRVWAPASHTHRWCSICTEDTANSEGERLWPVITERA